MPAARPRHGRRASPPSASGPAPQALGSPHKNPTAAARSPSHPRPLSLSVVAAPERRREGGGGAVQRGGGPGAERGGRRRRRHRSFTRSAPRTTTSTLPLTLHGFDPPASPLRCLSPPFSAPSVSSTAAVPLLSPSAASDAEEPSVANPRHPLPFRPPCRLFV
jgi:hypothetical protein